MTKSEARAAPPRDTVDCDREVWVMDRIRAAINMAIALERWRRVGADYLQVDSAVDGLVHGTAAEIIWLLGMKPSFTNIRRLRKEA